MTRQDTRPDISSHTYGTRKGEEQSGRGPTGLNPPKKTRTSRDATTINPEKRAPIDPRMPDLPPA
jgi:hypothetical protein